MPDFMPERPLDEPSASQAPLSLSGVQLAAQGAAGSAVRHIKSVDVVESSAGGVVWEGKVEVFEVLNPPPHRVYAWQENRTDGPEYVTVLGVHPVDSALAAVRSWLVGRPKKNSPGTS